MLCMKRSLGASLGPAGHNTVEPAALAVAMRKAKLLASGQPPSASLIDTCCHLREPSVLQTLKEWLYHISARKP